MTQHSRAACLLTVVLLLGGFLPASAQILPASRASAASEPSFEGVVEDEAGRPLQGVVVSVLGLSQSFVVSDRLGRFAFPGLAPGAYLLRAHRSGYQPAKGRMVRVAAGERRVERLVLSSTGGSPETEILAAGFAAADVPAATSAEPADGHGHDALEWRLRRARRSVLKDVDAIADLGFADQPFEGGPLGGFGRIVGGSARQASEWFSDLPLDGELNLLTTSLFERPQDLFSMGGDLPNGVAYLAIRTPAASGEWSLRGTVAQGDIASWMLAGAYAHRAPGPHQYEAGFSYSMQRYFGGNSEALAAIADGKRNVGALYAFDRWTVHPQVALSYGARYARYDYLNDPGLVSPEIGMIWRPVASDTAALRLSVAHRELAPGAQEFLPPTTGSSLPPFRTFSSADRDGFRVERVDRVEIGFEREMAGAIVISARGFREQVTDQGATLFGTAMAQPRGEVGHYLVGAAGNVMSTGWGLGLARALTQDLRASIDFTQFDADWSRGSTELALLAALAGPVLRSDERVRDLRARLEGSIPATETRVMVLYRVSNGFSPDVASVGATALDSRFDLQVNQALPFLRLTNTRWEMLVAVSNFFNDRSSDGGFYDELLVVRPPTRVVGGVSVRF